jgi:hypothetical protein
MLNSVNFRRRIKKGRSTKFYPRYLGPFKISEAMPKSSNCRLKLSPAVEFELIHPNFSWQVITAVCPQ